MAIQNFGHGSMITAAPPSFEFGLFLSSYLVYEKLVFGARSRDIEMGIARGGSTHRTRSGEVASAADFSADARTESEHLEHRAYAAQSLPRIDVPTERLPSPSVFQIGEESEGSI